MKHKSTVCFTFILFLFMLLSGCVSRNSNVDMYYTQNSDDSLKAVIIAPRMAYFESEINFDASKSYDYNGEIVDYVWNFMDGDTKRGKTVDHTFDFNGEYDTKFPIVYTVSLFVIDNEKNIQPCIHHIMLYPKNYHFYFSQEKMSSIKPMSQREKIGEKQLFDIDFTKKLSYSLEDAISIPNCSWNLSLYIEKPFFSMIHKISVSFFDENNKKISELEKSMGLNTFWKSKNIVLTGLLEEDIDLKSINIEVSGFKLENVNLIYGSNPESSVTFSLN